MSNTVRVVIVGMVILIAGGILVLKGRDAASSPSPQPSNNPATEPTNVAQSRPATQSAVTVPKLVDLGASKCIPCKMMAPILEELKREYAGKLDVVFIDVWKNGKAIGEYKIRSIPTQIFYDSTGKERFRHEGFFSKEDILAKWKELGVSLGPAK